MTATVLEHLLTQVGTLLGFLLKQQVTKLHTHNTVSIQTRTQHTILSVHSVYTHTPYLDDERSKRAEAVRQEGCTLVTGETV